jgi:hypothetical protein
VATVIAYIDGYNLYHGLKDKFGGRYLWLDPVKLVSRIRPRDTLLEVGYFTAKIRNDAHAESRQQSHLGAMSATGGSCLKITFGRYQEKSLTCRRCGSQWTTYEEKETDVTSRSRSSLTPPRHARTSVSLSPPTRTFARRSVPLGRSPRRTGHPSASSPPSRPNGIATISSVWSPAPSRSARPTSATLCSRSASRTRRRGASTTGRRNGVKQVWRWQEIRTDRPTVPRWMIPRLNSRLHPHLAATAPLQL